MTPFIVMEVLEKAQAMERQGISIIHMEVGEPDFDVPQCVKDAVCRAVSCGQTHYTHSLGDPELRQEIASLYRREYGVQFSPDQIVVSSGSSPAILMALRVLCQPGDEVLVFNPGYACYSNFVLAVNAIPVKIDLNPENGFQIDIESVRQKITPRTKAIFINSPSNPFGTLIEPETMKQIASLGIPVLSDEIYHGLVYEGRPHSILEYTDNAFVLNGFSKRYAMTGLRLGYLVAPQRYMRTLQIMQQNLFICAPSDDEPIHLRTQRRPEGRHSGNTGVSRRPKKHVPHIQRAPPVPRKGTPGPRIQDLGRAQGSILRIRRRKNVFS